VFVALVIQHAMRMRSVILSSVTCPALQYFTLFHKRHDLRNEKTYRTQNVWFDFLYSFVLNIFFFILRWMERDITKKCTSISVILVRLKKKNSFSRNTQISNFVKIRPVRA